MTTQPIGVTFSEELQKQMWSDDAVTHPIDFDDAWKWVGYSRKDVALRALEAEMSVPGQHVQQVFRNSAEKATGGRPSTDYYLTVDGFKLFCMAAGTVRGIEVRQQFLDVEKAYKRLVAKTAIKDVFPEPNTETVMVGSVGTRTPGVLTAENKWLEEITKLRQRVFTRLQSNPDLCWKKIAELDAQIEAGYAASLPFLTGKAAAPTSKKTAPPAPSAPVKPPTAAKWSTDLVQSQNGRVGAVFYKNRAVYAVPSLPEGEKIATVRYNTHAGRGRTPDIHVLSVFVIEAALDALLAAVTRTDVYISGDSLATGCFTAAIIAELGMARANRLLGRRIKAAGWQRVATYRTAGSGTAVIYEFVGGHNA